MLDKRYQKTFFSENVFWFGDFIEDLSKIFMSRVL